MNTICKTCNFDLKELLAKLDLSGRHHSIYCPVCGTKVIENVELPDVFYDEKEGTFIIWDLQMRRLSGLFSKSQRVGSLQLTVTGKPVNPYDLCYPRVVIFQHEDKIILPNTGIKPEFYRYLKPDAETSAGWEQSNFTFKANLRGVDNPVTLRRQALVSQTERGSLPGRYSKGTALYIWPNFRREGWHNYFVYFDTGDPEITLKLLRVIGENGKKAEFETTARGEIDFVPELIEIKVADRSNNDYWSCYRVEFKDDERIPPPAGGQDENLIPILALDFGTSNSCFAVKFSTEDRSEIVCFREHTKRIIQGLYVEDFITVPWFPEVQEGHSSPYQLPSELSFYKETKVITEEIRNLQPIVHYTIPPFTRYREGEEKYIQGEFKWERVLTSSLRPFAYDLQYLYLRLALRMALVEVVSDIRAQRIDRVDLVSTYPLAFSSD
ncbi:hypothetical protein FJZ31_11115 [Candidatus Poribacteria bacterium]|nr:hypothetical protein [Candidatus Poribacteria bacterium]